MILSVFYFTLFPILYCHGVLPGETIQVNPEQFDVNTEEGNYMNLEKNMRNIFGHAIFATAVSLK